MTLQHTRPGTHFEASRHLGCAELQLLIPAGLPFNPAVEGFEPVDDHQGMLTIESVGGGERITPVLSEEQLPRIC